MLVLYFEGVVQSHINIKMNFQLNEFIINPDPFSNFPF